MTIKSLCKKALAFAGVVAIVSGLASCSSDEIRYVPVKLASEGNWSMLDLTNGKLVFTDEFKEEPTIVSEGIFAVVEGEHVVLYKNGKKPKDLDTEVLLGAGLCKEGLIPVALKKERLQVLDASGKKKFELSPIDGKEIVSCSNSYTNGWLLVRLENNKASYIDKKANQWERSLM